MLIALILAAIADLALALLLLAVSGFIFGGGPEGANGESTAVVLWCLGLAGCLAAPVAGFVLRARRHPGWGLAIACLPPLIGAGFISV